MKYTMNDLFFFKVKVMFTVSVVHEFGTTSVPANRSVCKYDINMNAFIYDVKECLMRPM
jgi:hypothetical protein